MEPSVLERVVRVVRPYVRRTDVLKVTEDALLDDDLDINSARLIDLALALEDEFLITIKDDDIGNLKSIGDIVDYVKRTGKIVPDSTR